MLDIFEPMSHLGKAFRRLDNRLVEGGAGGGGDIVIVQVRGSAGKPQAIHHQLKSLQVSVSSSECGNNSKAYHTGILEGPNDIVLYKCLR